MKRGLPVVCALLLLVSAAAPAQQPAVDLPNGDEFLARARDKLLSSQQRQDRYAYRERRTELHTNPFGRIGTGGTVVYDVTPSPDGASLTRRLIERDGKPVANAPLETRDSAERRARTRPPRRSFDDVVSILQFKVSRREVVEGRPMVVVSFSPKPGAEPRTRQGRMAKAFVGDVWVDEALEEVVRVEATAVDNLSMGFGVVARLNEGTKVTLTRERVADGIWLPTSIRFVGEGRALLFRKLNVNYVLEWFDYRAVGS